MSLFKELTSMSSKSDNKQEDTDSVSSSMKQMIDLEAKFVMKEFTLTVSKQSDESIVRPFVRFELLRLEAELIQRTFNQEVMLRLGGVQVKQDHSTGEIFMINTPMSSGIEEYLIVIQFINVRYLRFLFILILEFTYKIKYFITDEQELSRILTIRISSKFTATRVYNARRAFTSRSSNKCTSIFVCCSRQS